MGQDQENNIIKDNINPDHYKNQTSLECIEAMLLVFGEQRVYDFCICNAWKYIWRYKNKNGMEDLKKALWYIDEAKDFRDDIFYGDLLERMEAYIHLVSSDERKDLDE